MSICLLPWIHIEADATGRAKPCCLYDPNSIAGDFSKQSLNEIWHGEFMNNLRNEFLEGKKPKGCEQCWATEAAGNRSKRQTDYERFKHLEYKINAPLEPPVYYDLKLGTVCNIKCRICSTFSSFKWAEDEKLIYGEVLNPNLRSYWIEDNSPLWKDLESIIPHVEYFDFTGGEPFLIKRHVELLRKCVETGHAKNISIHYNTNGTITPTDEMFEIWRHFKWVEVMFSLDGTEKQFEYQRHPAKWNEVQDNFSLVKSKDYLHTSVCHTVNIFNVLYLDNFIEWFSAQNLSEDRLYLNLLHGPEHYNIKALPANAKDEIAKYISKDHIVEFMMSEQFDCIDKFVKYTHILDESRNENFEETFPELARIIL